ncbi:MAG: hypothetical protein CFE31_05785 [Rhizobiales bacterium PAR1]|nr:MAG: hypothetical protein CFE31_05785 [Rhizobiales bacterium PAR1]
MSSDVNFSLANALVDFGAARRIDPKGLESIQNTHSDEAAKTPRFDHLVSDHEQAARVAAQTRTRSDTPEPQRALHPADRRPAAPRAEPRRAERPEASVHAESEAEAPARKEEASSAKSDETKATARDADKTSDEAEKSAAAEAVDAKDGSADATTPATTAQATPAATPVTDPKASDATLLADASAVINPAVATATGASVDATAMLAETGAVPGATTSFATATSASDVPPTSVPTVGSATTGVAAPELEVALLAASVAKAGETGKAATQASTGQVTSETDATEGVETASSGSTATAKPVADAKAQLAALLDGEKKASGVEAGKGDKVASVEGASEKGGMAKAANAGLHPTRTVHFADALEGFMASNAIHRPADILAGLDRSVAAQAMNKTSDIARPTPLQMLPIEIGMQAVRGVTSFQIRLDPAELGRVDVKLHIQDNGEVKANLIVDRVDTLNMLRRDASTLQNAFEQAGLKQTPDGLTFSLRGEGQQGQQQEQGQQGGRHASDIPDDLALQAQIGEAAMRRVLIPNSSIDRMV